MMMESTALMDGLDQEEGLEEIAPGFQEDECGEETPSGEAGRATPSHEVAERGLSVYDPLHRYLMEVRKYPFLSKEEEHRLAIAAHEEGSLQAITELVLSHLRLVASIAMEYKHLPMDIMDLIQEGNIGLMQGIKKFDPYRNIRVATYVAWWIRAYILKYILQNWRLVKMGTTEIQRKLFFNLSKERERLEKLGYTPGPKLLADRLHVKEEEVIDVEQRLRWGQEVSLDHPGAYTGGGEEEGEALCIPSAEAPIEEQYAKEQLAEIFKSQLKAFSETLKPRDREILLERVLSETPMTLEALGAKHKISKERVRQLEENLIKKLRKFVEQKLKGTKDHLS